jgi:thioredoxin 1
MKTLTQDPELQAAVRGTKTVVHFHATWCPFCRAFKPSFDRTSADVKGWETLECIIDDEENPIWRTYGIQAVPTVLFFEDGKVSRRLDARLGVGLTEKDLRGALKDAGAL